MYFKMCPYNLMGVENDSKFGNFIVISITIQIIILYIQEKYRSNFFIPKRFHKGYYNYFKSESEIKKMNVDINTVINIYKPY
jgi:hypothetical protein